MLIQNLKTLNTSKVLIRDDSNHTIIKSYTIHIHAYSYITQSAHAWWALFIFFPSKKEVFTGSLHSHSLNLRSPRSTTLKNNSSIIRLLLISSLKFLFKNNDNYESKCIFILITRNTFLTNFNLLNPPFIRNCKNQF